MGLRPIIHVEWNDNIAQESRPWLIFVPANIYHTAHLLDIISSTDVHYEALQSNIAPYKQWFRIIHFTGSNSILPSGLTVDSIGYLVTSSVSLWSKATSLYCYIPLQTIISCLGDECISIASMTIVQWPTTLYYVLINFHGPRLSKFTL